MPYCNDLIPKELRVLYSTVTVLLQVKNHPGSGTQCKGRVLMSVEVSRRQEKRRDGGELTWKLEDGDSKLGHSNEQKSRCETSETGGKKSKS